ncbi:MAG: aldo/keto reductase [bacterium]
MLNWGIIGLGGIAHRFASELPESKTGKLVAVGSRSQETADKFGAQYGVSMCYGSYEALLADPEVQAVYIATPHPMHAEWAIKAAEAGKHILCEKPITLDYSEATAVIDAAKQHKVFLMEAFMYRCHPQTAKLAELIFEGVIGEVKLIQVSFSFRANFDPESRLFKNALGGGGILDVGCYTTTMSSLIAGAALGLPFAEPINVVGRGCIGDTGVDEFTAAILTFPNNIIAQVATGVRLNQENVLRIFGTEGDIFVPNPFFCSPPKIIVNVGQKSSEVVAEPWASLYAQEADVVAESIVSGSLQAPSPAMSWDDTLGNMKTLDAWRKSIGVIYDAEKPTANYPTVDRRPLQVNSETNMKYGRIEGVDKPVSKMVMGTMLGGALFPLPHASVLFDEYFRNGGNCFDTAHVYGESDAILGQWIKNRGIREQVVVLGKGSHTPNCYPEQLTAQLYETLENMQTDYLDIYMMHRDNLEVPVEEFVDVLNEHSNAGRMRAFGGSNWTLERVAAANEYAKSKGLQGFSAVSNNFSLACMMNPPWDGCLSVSDTASREWFIKTQLPLMPWSSTGMGFFVFGDPCNQSDDVLVNSWYSDDNFKRLSRVKELATQKGVEPIQIAMAYVLCQPFPIYPLFGPSNIFELRISLKALDIKLTEDEMKWLNLESDYGII